MSLFDHNPFWQEEAVAEHARQQRQAPGYWIQLGAKLADEIYIQVVTAPTQRDYIAKCARDSVNQVCNGDLSVKELIAQGFKSRMKVYGAPCNG